MSVSENRTAQEVYFYGFEARRNTLKYRATQLRYMNWSVKAGSQALSYGRTGRVKLNEQNRRNFTPTPHATLSWRRSYNLHSAMERIFSRFAPGYRFERYYIRGHAKNESACGTENGTGLKSAVFPFSGKLFFNAPNFQLK